MTPRTPEQIYEEMQMPGHIAIPAMFHKTDQDVHRGDWLSPRDAEQPDVPWPHPKNPILTLLVSQFQQMIDAGIDLDTAATELAVKAWFEGGIESYDRGQFDAREVDPCWWTVGQAACAG